MHDADLIERARRRQSRRLVLGLALAVVAMLGGAGFALLDHEDSGRPNSGLARELAFLGLPLVFLLLVFGLVVLARRRGVAWVEPIAAGGLDRNERRPLLRAIRTGERLPDPDDERARDLARALARQGPLQAVVAIGLVVDALIIVPRGLDALGVAVLLSMVLYLVGMAVVWRDVVRARRYLRMPR